MSGPVTPPPPPPDALQLLKHRVMNRLKSIKYSVSTTDSELAKFCFEPRKIQVIGASSGRGKSVFAMQMLLGALKIDPTLRAAVLNTEMTEDELYERLVSHLAQVPYNAIIDADYLPEEQNNIAIAFETLEAIKPRLRFLDAACPIKTALIESQEFGAKILLFDRIQKVTTAETFSDNRLRLDYILGEIRQHANTYNVAVLEISECNKPTRNGAPIDNDNLLTRYSYKETQEFLLHGDKCFLLKMPKKQPHIRILEDVKQRRGKEGANTLNLHFHEDYMTFRGVEQ